MTTTSTSPITDEQRLTMLKHLAAGKDLDQVATIVGKPRPLVLDVVSKHGYPHSLEKGIELLTAKIDKERNELPAGTAVAAPRIPRPASSSPSSVTHADARPISHAPDEIRILINTAKSHPSKRIQTQADRVLDAIGKLRDLITEDEAKHAERRREEQAKAATRAEIARLEKQLADAKAKLRGTPAVASGGGPTTKRSHPKTDMACTDCGKTLHTTEAGMRLHSLRAHRQPAEAAS